jgi:hypothetical protein
VRACAHSQVVTEPHKDTAYPEREGLREQHPEHCRKPKTLELMLQRMEVDCNEKLRAAGHSELIKEELVGGRMYTGPVRVT